jgi:hypothetical protein
VNRSFALHDVPAAKPVAGYVGGKRQLARELARRIAAVRHSLYGEVFAGMAGVFFARQQAPQVEVLNDISRDVATFFRVLQNHHQALMDMLRWQLASRAEFDRLNGQDPERLTDLQRAARFLYVQRLAFGGSPAETSAPAHDDAVALRSRQAGAAPRPRRTSGSPASGSNACPGAISSSAGTGPAHCSISTRLMPDRSIITAAASSRRMTSPASPIASDGFAAASS